LLVRNQSPGDARSKSWKRLFNKKKKFSILCKLFQQIERKAMSEIYFMYKDRKAESKYECRIWWGTLRRGSSVNQVSVKDCK
jgi:hypothetical protein